MITSELITKMIQTLPLPEVEKRTPLQIAMPILLEAMNRRMDQIEAVAGLGDLGTRLQRMDRMMDLLENKFGKVGK